MLLSARQHRISFPRRPLVMGIVNLNDDSFCGDGTLDVALALDQAALMLRDGADIIDIGAESARTNRGPISIDEEIRRLRAFVEQWPRQSARGETQSAKGKAQSDDSDALRHAPCAMLSVSDAMRHAPCAMLSVNTWRSEVVKEILPLGGDILNDLSALPDARNAELCAQHGAALVIMHSIGLPKVPHTRVRYDDIMDSLDVFFEKKMALARAAGLNEEQIILDPGIDFAKQRDDNLRVYRELDRLHRFGRPILLPVSRKTVIGEVCGLENPLDRDAGTIACIAAGLRRGAQIFRVHHVAAAAQAVTTLWNLQEFHANHAA